MVLMLQKKYKKIEIQHNMAHAPDAFSSLRSCEGAGDADVIPPLETSLKN
jgi:hypothetical protein